MTSRPCPRRDSCPNGGSWEFLSGWRLALSGRGRVYANSFALTQTCRSTRHAIQPPTGLVMAGQERPRRLRGLWDLGRPNILALLAFRRRLPATARVVSHQPGSALSVRQVAPKRAALAGRRSRKPASARPCSLAPMAEAPSVCRLTPRSVAETALAPNRRRHAPWVSGSGCVGRPRTTPLPGAAKARAQA
jgi:hypothetical protein